MFWEAPLGISAKTRKMLWGRAASRCAMPDCRKELVEDISETDDPTLIGEECHIVAQEVDGPRGKSPLTEKERDKYANLILLCCNHHKVVDDNEAAYSIAKLLELKKNHENWVRSSLTGYDTQKQRDDETYAGYLEDFENAVDLEEWKTWTSSLLSHGHPCLDAKKLEELTAAREWLFRRVWPRRYPALEAAFENFRRVLGDLLNTMEEYGEDIGEGDNKRVQIEKRYQRLKRWDPPTYEKLSAEFNFAVGLVQDLVLELTRAANLICEQVRLHLMPSYRLKEGLVVVMAGPFMDMSWKTFRPRYAAGIKPESAYQGRDWFLKHRYDRDVNLSEEEPEAEDDVSGA
jgi:hypothetical protein